MKRIYFVRHGQSVANANGEKMTGPDHATDLTELGRTQANNVGEWFGKHDFKFEIAYCSPYKRTQETLKYINQGYRKFKDINFNPRIDSRLRERVVVFGDKTHDEFKMLLNSDPCTQYFHESPICESIASVCDRAHSFMNDIRTLDVPHNSNILVVSHKLFINAIHMNVLGTPPEQFSMHDGPKNVGIYSYMIKDNGWFINELIID